MGTPCSGVWAPTELSYFTASCSFVLMVFATTGNVIVCLAVYKDPYKRLRTPFMFILVNLAITDLTVGAITMPLSVATHTLEGLAVKKPEHATISRMTYFISCTASILNLTAFCVDRYIAINWPIKYRRMLNAKVCLLVSISIWLSAIAISLLYFVTGYINYLFIFAHVAFVLASGIGIVTFQLLRKLNTYSRERRAITNPVSKYSNKSDKRVTKLFLVILFMFFLCYTPAIVMMYILKFCPKCDCTARHVLRDLQFLFIASNSAVNPFVCTIRLKPFRQAIANIFHMNKATEEVVQPVSSNARRGTEQFMMRFSFLKAKDAEKYSSTVPLKKHDECYEKENGEMYS